MQDVLRKQLVHEETRQVFVDMQTEVKYSALA